MHATGLQEYKSTYQKMKRVIIIVVAVAREQGTALQFQKPRGVHVHSAHARLRCACIIN